MDQKNRNEIYPVILKVPYEKLALSGKESVRFLRQFARKAVIASARKSGFSLPILENDSNGAPVPSKGVYWSLSHKPEYVAGVTANMRVGIDIEPVRPVQPVLFDKVIDGNERQLFGRVTDTFFYRVWTAKEAVLKAAGVGLRELSRCKVFRIPDKNNLVLFYRQKCWMIQHLYYDNHVVSMSVEKDQQVRWCLPEVDDRSEQR